MKSLVVVLSVVLLGCIGCRDVIETGEDTGLMEKEGMTMKVSSSAFDDGAAIPGKYTGDGADVSPALSWTEPPEGTKGFVLICDDPDAPMRTWVHWVLYDLPPETRELPEAVPAENTTREGAKQGINDFRKIGYGGPAPPPGKPHRYFFKLYAVDQMTGLEPGATKRKVLRAIKGHVLAETQVIGTYSR